MTKKIIIAGAGLGGLSLAYELGERDYEVIILEKAVKGKTGYIWADEIEQGVFDELNLPLPENTHTSPGWAFVPPFSQDMLITKKEKGEGEYEIRRREFATLMENRASKAQILYETQVTELIVENGCAVGVNTDKGEFRGDLVVDCLGADSVLRKNLPQDFDIEPTTDQIFHAYKGQYKRSDAPAAEPTNKVYIKHLGNAGISWCLDRDGYVDILIGRLTSISDKHIATALKDLAEQNPCMDKELSGSGEIYLIPVRYPLSKLVHNGYVILGDSGYMTVPIMGSGMASAMRAGKILADIIIKKSAPYSTKDLWEYQAKVFAMFGSLHAGIDVVKRGLLNMENSEVVNIFTKGILTDDDVKMAMSGKPIQLSWQDKLQKIKSGIKFLPTLLKMNKILTNMNKAKKIADAIPQSYNPQSVEKWRKKLDGFFLSL